MTEKEEDCGCDSLDTDGSLKPEQIDSLKSKMGQTQQTLEQMLSTVQSLDIDLSKFSQMEDEINKISNYMQSGGFLNSLEKLVEKAQENDPRTSPGFQAAMDYRKKYLNDVNIPGFDFPKKKEPIGYVWVDEEGNQKFSVEKPTDVMAMPVYGE